MNFRVIVKQNGRPVSVHDCEDRTDAERVKEELRLTTQAPAVIQWRDDGPWVDAEDVR